MPGLCKFDPNTVIGETIQCTNSVTKITPKAAKFVSLVWAGPSDSSGSLWYGLAHDAALVYLAATNCTSPSNHCKNIPFPVAEDWQNIFLSRNSSADALSVSHAEYTRHFRQSVNEFSSIIGTHDPDLTRFKQAGGKMISWHGTKDQVIFYNGTENYYQNAMEVDPNLHDYYRFFLAPGAEHCSPGIGFFPGSSFEALVEWVENGKAPDTLQAIATPTATGSARPPLRTAGLCPYPEILSYTGDDASKASSFTCK